MTTFPGGIMTGFPLAWQVVDAPTSRLICEVRNLMPDPGDGAQLKEPNLTIMTYAGDGLFSREEDIYDPLACADVGEVGQDRRGARQPQRRGPRLPHAVRLVVYYWFAASLTGSPMKGAAKRIGLEVVGWTLVAAGIAALDPAGPGFLIARGRAGACSPSSTSGPRRRVEPIKREALKGSTPSRRA